MVRTKMNVGDKVSVYLNTPRDSFVGTVTRVSDGIANDIWYEVKPDGEGVSQGRPFWHRENHVRKVSA